MSKSAFLAFGAYYSEFCIERRDTFRYFYFLCTLEADFVIADKGDSSRKGLMASHTTFTHVKLILKVYLYK